MRTNFSIFHNLPYVNVVYFTPKLSFEGQTHQPHPLKHI